MARELKNLVTEGRKKLTTLSSKGILGNWNSYETEKVNNVRRIVTIFQNIDEKLCDVLASSYILA